MSLLIVCMESSGGLADYAHCQAEAISRLGIQVTLLVPADFLHQSPRYRLAADLPPSAAILSSRLLQRLSFVARLLISVRLSEAAIRTGGFRWVLFTSYTEYLAPIWAWRFRRWRSKGVCFGAVVHDPVRNYQVGPRWWHRLSIAEGYSFLEHAFVHAPIALDTGRPMPSLTVSVIPHGPYSFPVCDLTPLEARELLDVPAKLPLLLCFGRLRDDKNLHLVLDALASDPTAHLLIAGPESTPGQRNSRAYQILAEQLGIQDRCHWHVAFHSPEEVAILFRAADAVVIAYSASFRSASGVLNVAAQFGLPVLASGGDSALVEAVSQYRLGVVVAPDDSAALAEGLQSLLASRYYPDWNQYCCANSWKLNARGVAVAMGLLLA